MCRTCLAILSTKSKTIVLLLVDSIYLQLKSFCYQVLDKRSVMELARPIQIQSELEWHSIGRISLRQGR